MQPFSEKFTFIEVCPFTTNCTFSAMHPLGTKCNFCAKCTSRLNSLLAQSKLLVQRDLFIVLYNSFSAKYTFSATCTFNAVCFESALIVQYVPSVQSALSVQSVLSAQSALENSYERTDRWPSLAAVAAKKQINVN